VLLSNLGGRGPSSVEDAADIRFLANNDVSRQGIYYAGIGTEEIVTPEDTKIQFFDLYVINKTAYVPNNALRNGKRANEVGDFGVINLADNQECEFEYTFVDRTAGPLSLLHTFRRPLTGC